MTDYSALDRYVADHLAAWTDELADLCRFPSEATVIARARPRTAEPSAVDAGRGDAGQ